MAVAISPSDCSNPYLFGVANSWETSSSVPLSMVDVMSYHYPPLHSNDNEMGMPPPTSFIPSYTIPSRQLSSLPTVDQQAPLLSQQHGMEMKGVHSAPNSVSLLATEADEQQQKNGSAGEKKRNKLGYHRHCRRRKIRCIASPNDTQGRCINCIRLKKECSFFPVDQESIDDSRGRQGSKASTGAKGNSTTSSPATSISKPVEQSRRAKPSFVPSAKRPLPITVPTTGDATGAVGFQPQTNASLPSPSSKTPIETSNQTTAGWIITAPDQSPSTSSELSAPWQTYASGSPMSTQFSPFTSVAQSPSGWPPGTSESIPQGNVDTAWGHFAPPTRSMSYGGEPLNNNHPSQYSLMAPGRQFERRSSALSDAYTTSMNGVVPGFDGSNVNTPIPFPPAAVPPANYTTWDQTNAYTDYRYMKGHEAYGHDWSQANRGQDHGLQLPNDGQQVMNNAPPMNLYQSQ
ncbi:hypothetical protein FSST1_003398 [Fusarium sambucinum]